VAPILLLAVLAVAVVLLARCVDADEAFSFVDGRLLALIFSMLAVGAALQASGAVALVVDGLAPLIGNLPPMLATDDALTFSPYTDAMLMVAEAGETRRDDLEQSLQILKDVPLLGTVLNKAENTANQYYGRYGHD